MGVIYEMIQGKLGRRRNYLAEVKGNQKNHESIHTTASRLAELVGYGGTLKAYNKGLYPGTRIPLRPIPENAPLVVYANGRVEDKDGGWIADRFGRLGRRQTTKVFAAHGKVLGRNQGYD